MESQWLNYLNGFWSMCATYFPIKASKACVLSKMMGAQAFVQVYTGVRAYRMGYLFWVLCVYVCMDTHDVGPGVLWP